MISNIIDTTMVGQGEERDQVEMGPRLNPV